MFWLANRKCSYTIAWGGLVKDFDGYLLRHQTPSKVYKIWGRQRVGLGERVQRSKLFLQWRKLAESARTHVLSPISPNQTTANRPSLSRWRRTSSSVELIRYLRGDWRRVTTAPWFVRLRLWPLFPRRRKLRRLCFNPLDKSRVWSSYPDPNLCPIGFFFLPLYPRFASFFVCLVLRF